MDLFETPRKVKKVPSPLLSRLKDDMKATDELPQPEWKHSNAPPLVGGIHKRPREENVSDTALFLRKFVLLDLASVITCSVHFSSFANMNGLAISSTRAYSTASTCANTDSQNTVREPAFEHACTCLSSEWLKCPASCTTCAPYTVDDATDVFQYQCCTIQSTDQLYWCKSIYKPDTKHWTTVFSAVSI